MNPPENPLMPDPYWMDTLASRVAARYKSKKTLDTGTVVYQYSERQVARRNADKAKRLEGLRSNIAKLRTQVKKDLKSHEPDKLLTALVVALIDETFERVGNDDSADEGHFGVTGWQKSHVSFGKGQATIKYVGKSGVKQKKTVKDKAIVQALRDAYEACPDDCIFEHDTGKVTATKVNAYLKRFGVTAKDLRGFHANREMQERLRAARKGALPMDAKERTKKLKDEFKAALEATAEAVGHEASTLRSQYLVPGLEEQYLKDGTIETAMVKKATELETYEGFELYAGSQDESALGIVMAGVSMLLSQAVVVSNPFFDENEIKRYLTLRRSFHESFTKACNDLADAFDDGLYGPQAKTAVQPLRSIAQMTVKQDKAALRLLTRTLRGLKNLSYQDIQDAGGSPRLLKVIRSARSLDRSDSTTPSDYSSTRLDSYLILIEDALRLPEVPAPMKTLFRKVLKNKGFSGPAPTVIDEKINVGAWFDMDAEQKASLRKLAEQLVAQQGAVFKDEPDPEKRHELYKTISEKLRKVVNAAGVNLKILTGEDREPLDAVLKREAKLEMDGPTEFILRKVEAYVLKAGTYRSRGKWEDEPSGPVPREVGKLLTVLRKAKTFGSVERVLKEAVERGTLGPSTLEDLQNFFQDATKNRGIREGKRLAPITWEPKTPEQFQEEHNTGPVEFSDELSEDEQKEVLGRVSRAIGDLESVFGKGFCGKHAKKLAFRFGGKAGFMAAAHYFAWDDKTQWQPRVTFGEEYEGVLAHELSHYFEDMMAYRISKVEDPERTKEQERRGFGAGPGVVFGNTGVPLERYGSEGTLSSSRDRIGKTIPELVEFIDTVLGTKDYQRWCDYMGSAFDTALPRAVQNLTGKSTYDLPKDHPYANATDAKYKSQLPPELVAEAEKVYRNLMDGDDRKLNYVQSAVEVWARMCEQYVYNKLIQAGISNPWLTWMSYDDDKYMDEKTFDEKLMPVMDRLFAALGTKNILTARRLVARYLQGMGGSHETSDRTGSSLHPQ